jgi:hypothetical protein
VHSATGVVSYCRVCKLLFSVTRHIRSVASVLLCRIAHCMEKCVPLAEIIGPTRLRA